jgi:hypothetical protein
MDRVKVYEAIDSERDYQAQKWGEKPHSPEEWFLFIEDYVSEAKHILSRELYGYPKAMEIMRKVGGMAVAAMEQHGTTNRCCK